MTIPHSFIRKSVAALAITLPSLATFAQDAASDAAELAPMPQRIWESSGVLHPAVVHFPVALLTIAAMFIVLGKIFKKISPDVAYYTLLLGALSTIVATALGWSFSPYMGYGGWDKGYDPENLLAVMDVAVFNHRWAGVALAAFSSLAALLALIARCKENDSKSLNHWWKGITLLCAIGVGIVGHQGGELVYGEDFYDKAITLALEGPPVIEAIETPPHEAGQPVDFVLHVKPIFEATCIACHGPDKDKGDFRLDNHEDAMNSDIAIIPDDAESSDIVWLVELDADDDDVMPPEGKAPPLTAEQKLILRDWVDQGAKWPEGLVLEDKAPKTDEDAEEAEEAAEEI